MRKGVCLSVALVFTLMATADLLLRRQLLARPKGVGIGPVLAAAGLGLLAGSARAGGTNGLGIACMFAPE